MQRFIIIACALAFTYWFFAGRDASIAIETADGYAYPSYTIEPAKAYQMQARVLSRRDYSSGREAELSPVDLALGWGPMMDSDTLKEIKISQSGRFYFWKVGKFPIPRKAIEHNSANVHIVPANKRVAQELAHVSAGDMVELSGQLINVSADDGWRWRSSLSFTDTGKGACELLWLEGLRTI
jgi:hypothetical protein